MKYVKIAILIKIIIFITGVIVLAENEKTAISYNDFIKTVTEKLPEIQKNRLQVDKAKNNLESTYASDDINITAGGSRSLSGSYSEINKKITASSLLNTGISKKLSQTGTTVESGIAYETIKSESVGKYSPSLYVRFSQSVLKNSFGVVDRYAMKNAEMKLEIQKLKQKESDKASLNNCKKLYFTWTEINKRIQLVESSLNYAVIIQKDIQKKFTAGLAGIEDVYNANALVDQYRIKMQEITEQKDSIGTELKIFTGRDIYPETKEFVIIYNAATEIDYANVSFEKTQNAEIYRLTKTNYIYSKEINENKLLPELNIIGKYSRRTSEDKLSFLSNNNVEHDYYIGFTASYPLWNIEAKSAVEESDIAVREINVEYNIASDSYKCSLEKLVNKQNNLKKIIQITESRIKSLEARYNAVYKKYRYGSQSLQQVIDALQDITGEKNNLIQYQSILIQGYIDYSDLTS